MCIVVELIPMIVSAIPTLLAALTAATIAVYGNRRLLSGLGRRLRDAEELEKRLYHILTLTADYWTIVRNRTERQKLEARILAEKHIIISQLDGMSRHTRKLRNWHQQTREMRLDLIDDITGGCFQQKAWSTDPERVLRAAHTIRSLISSLHRSC